MPWGLVKGIATGLAKRGVIRGSVGRFLGYKPKPKMMAGSAGGGSAAFNAAYAAWVRGGKRGSGPNPAAYAAGGAVAVSLPRMFAPPPPPLPTMRRPGVAGTIQRILPGGKSGYMYDPMPDAARDKAGRPVAVVPEVRERTACPPGYVAVDLDGDGVKDACVLKGFARSAGLWKARPKPPVSAADAHAIRRASRAQDRVKKLAGNVGLKYCKPPAGKSGRFKKKGKR